MIKTAEISDCRFYRYGLGRTWSNTRPLRTVCWVMLNPSKADHEIDDPTIKRVVSFSQDWKFDGALVVNLYAWRATDPRELYLGGDVVGPRNDQYIRAALLVSSTVVCAWGKAGPDKNRPAQVLQLIRAAGHRPLALRVNKDGNPGHPLYIAGDTPLVRYAA